MKRLFLLSSVALMLLAVPYIAPEINVATAEAGVVIATTKTVTAYCFDSDGDCQTQKVRVRIENQAPVKVDGVYDVYPSRGKAPNGRYFRYYFEAGGAMWYFDV